jgi:hypothetical protein
MWYSRTGSMQLQRTAYRRAYWTVGSKQHETIQQWARPRHRESVTVSPSGSVARAT